MQPKTLLALVAVLMCTACADQKTAQLTTPQNEQLASIRWDEATSANHAALTRNAGLIMMR